MYYKVPVQISKQEDGLWRVEAPDLQGCFVDAETIEQALAEIHEVVAMMVDVYQEKGWVLPTSVVQEEHLPVSTMLPICVTEHKFRRIPASAAKRKVQP